MFLDDAISNVKSTRTGLDTARGASDVAHAAIAAETKALATAQENGVAADAATVQAIGAFNQSLRDLSDAALAAIVITPSTAI